MNKFTNFFRKYSPNAKKSSLCLWKELVTEEMSSANSNIITNFFFPPGLSPKVKRKRKLCVRAECQRVTMNGVQIMLPPAFKLYPSQQTLVLKVLQSLNTKQNAMLESPTGSGKTMALLASSCAWLQKYNAVRKSSKASCPKHGTSESPEMAGFNVEEQDETEEDQNSSMTPALNSSRNPFDLEENELSGDPDNSFHDDHNKFCAELASDDAVTSSPNENIVACTCKNIRKIRIYYGTRTHQQITQVLDEYAKLPCGFSDTENQLQHTIFASREQSCLNPDVRKSANITTSCKERIAPEGIGCNYRRNLRPYERNAPKLRKKLEREEAGVWNVEELGEALKGPEICPYFASNRTLALDADVIFTPFNYLLDPIIRASSTVCVKNSIVILDEAHNLEDVCREAVSFSFTEPEIWNALRNFEEKRAAIQKFLGSNRKEKCRVKADLREIQEYDKAIGRLNQFVLRLQGFCTKLVVPATEKSKSWDWKEFLSLLADEDDDKTLNLEKNNPLFLQYRTDFLAITSQKPKDDADGTGSSDSLKAFQMSPGTITLIEKLLFFFTYFHHAANKEYYKCNLTFVANNPGVAAEPSKKTFSRVTFNPCRRGFEYVLNFWCMSPAVACAEAFRGVRSLILASGTLCPMQSLQSELGMQFAVEMEGQQVIPKEQIFASIVSKSQDNFPLICNYKNMQDPQFFSQLLKSISAICNIVPGGILVFVSSYRVMNQIKQTLDQEVALCQGIEKVKKIFWEPYRSSELGPLMQEFENIVKSSNPTTTNNGAILFAVYRGKVSEGIDFRDDMARAVICVGIPFPNAFDDQVLQKKIFNNQNCCKLKILSGDEWYSTQAYRALNQALGRCLRHRNDWGAIFLVDSRFIEKANPKNSDSKKLSRWVRNSLLRFPDHNLMCKALSAFVSSHMKDP